MVPDLPLFTVGSLQEKYLSAIFSDLIDGQRVGADSFSTDGVGSGDCGNVLAEASGPAHRGRPGDLERGRREDSANL